MLSSSDLIELNTDVTDDGTVLNLSSLESALSSWHYYEDVRVQVCSIFVGLVRNHAFKDGNKRTAVLTFLALVDTCGLSLDLSDDELFDVTMSVALKKLSPEQTAAEIWGKEQEDLGTPGGAPEGWY